MKQINETIQEFKTKMEKLLYKEIQKTMILHDKKIESEFKVKTNKMEFYPVGDSSNFLCNGLAYKNHDLTDLVKLANQHGINLPKISLSKTSVSKCLTCGSKNGFHIEYCQDVMDENMETKEEWV